MKIHMITGPVPEENALLEDYRTAHAIGSLRIGNEGVFFRSKMKTYHIPFSEIRRCFRRVQLVSARMCCGRGNLAVENLVICTDEGEAAQIQLPGDKAARIAMEELRSRAPHALFGCPDNTQAAL